MAVTNEDIVRFAQQGLDAPCEIGEQLLSRILVSKTEFLLQIALKVHRVKRALHRAPMFARQMLDALEDSFDRVNVSLAGCVRLRIGPNTFTLQ